MKLKLFASLVLATLALASCDNTTDTLGFTITDIADNLTISTDTFTVTTRSIKADSVISRNTTAYLGKIRDPETGSYITGDCMVQFNTFENYSFPTKDSIRSLVNGQVIADSVEIRLYYDDFYGDSLQTMKLRAYEMNKPMDEGVNYYSNFSPLKEGYVRSNGLTMDKVYSLTDLNMDKDTRYSSSYRKNIRINLDKEYKGEDGVTYNNFGTYLMRKYYEHPEYYKNSYSFIHNLVPGFFFKNVSGLGSMAYVSLSQLNVYFRYTYKDSIYTGIASFPGTEEVLQTTTITNDNTINQLAADNTCTYLKAPAGIFTEMTLPIDNIVAGHENDSINTAKVTLTRINNTTTSDYALDVPQTLLMIPKAQLYSFL
jgi:predicted small secreted protein